jgi:hypothetical protein
MTNSTERIIPDNKNYNKIYYIENKDKLNISSKLYSIANKDAISENKKKYYAENKESIIAKKKLYRELNKAHIKEIRKQYRLKNKEKIAKQKKVYQDKILSTDVGKLKHNIRQAIRRSLTSKGFNKKFSSENILGCTILVFKEYLESKFEPWMTWDNKGLYNGELNYGWDIDHIIPLSSAITENDVIKLNHYTNIQPLCSYTNRDKKKNRLL